MEPEPGMPTHLWATLVQMYVGSMEVFIETVTLSTITLIMVIDIEGITHLLSIIIMLITDIMNVETLETIITA